MSDLHYSQRRHLADQEYDTAYAEWIATMTPEERREAERMGVLEAKLDHAPARNVGREHDAASMAVTPAASHEEVVTGDLSRLVLEEALRAIAAHFIASKNAKLDIIALCFATGSSACHIWNGNQAEAARAMGVQRMNLNKAIKRFQRNFGLPVNNFTRPAAVSRKLSRVQKDGHWRHAKFTATPLTCNP